MTPARTTAPARISPGTTPKNLAMNTHRFRGRDLLTLSSLTRADVDALFAAAREIKADITPFRDTLRGTSLVLLFEKPSLRTKVSFEVGIAALGGNAVFMDHSAQRLGEREAVKDYARNLDRWVHAIIARVYSQATLEELAEHARIPVINALSDRFHPCQALADLYTLDERARARGVPLREMRLAYVGDGNNVCHSLMHAATLLDVSMTVITPKGREPARDVVSECTEFARAAGSSLTLTNDPAAVESHHALYTDVWVSMGENGNGATRRTFAPYQVNAALMERASRGVPGGSLFMHCLPARRGEEVTDDVIDSPNSVVYDQAENRMHVQNALLLQILLR